MSESQPTSVSRFKSADSQNSPSSLVDSHCHLDLATRKGEDPGALVAQAKRAGVSHLLTVSVDLSSARKAIGYAHQFEGVFATVGVHPNARLEKEPDVSDIVALADDNQVLAIGETGLDAYRSQGDADATSLDAQRLRFRTHIRAAREVGKPLVIHSRDAKDEVLSILEEENACDVGGIMHCFVEDWETGQRVLDLGFFLSFSGVVTYKNATIVKESATKAPLDRLLVETDSPYLAPVPHRGRTNCPAYVRYVAEYIAELKEIEPDSLFRATTENFFRLGAQDHG